MPTDSLAANDDLVAGLQKGIGRGEWGLSEVPAALKLVLRRESWRERRVQQTGETAVFESFAQFVTAPLVEGLGTDIATIKRLCRDDAEALDALDKATVGKRGKRNNVTFSRDEPERGNGRQYAIRKLRAESDDPQCKRLYEQVIAGELSPHAAMVEAGFRPKTITHPTTVDGFARAARKHLDPAQLAALREALR